LRFSRYEMNILGIPVHEVVKASADKLKALSNQRKVKVKMNIPRSYIVLADEKLLEISLEKLIENAINNAPPKTEVTIGAELQGQKVNIFVRDLGTHFAPTEIDYTFRFYELKKKDRKADFKRFTPGLAIVKLVMDLHKTDVEVANIEDGGVRVSFLLPEY